jgi:hypothetical protein
MFAHRHTIATLAVIASTALPLPAAADAVTEWNLKSTQWVAAAGLPPPPAYRAMAIVQVCVHDAISAIAGRHPPIIARVEAAPGASIDAAIAAATRGALSRLAPAQQAAIDAAYAEALAAIPDGPAKTNGIAAGEKAAAAVLSARADDGAAAPDGYRPATSPGVYVPTVIPAVPHWGKRRTWSMTSSDQFRPGPPPALSSATWARDYNEIKAVGGRNSAQRTPAQTDIARFWEATGPIIYYPVVRSAAEGSPGRDASANARLLALAGMAMDDALIAVFDAKYAYNFWRPVTAIRNGDIDGNDATERDASWAPLIDTPMHPEYPCAHCIVAGAVGTVIVAETGSRPAAPLSSRSPTAGGAVRTWASAEEFMAEVSLARIYDGVHYRNSTEVGRAMGERIGEQIARKYLAQP